MATRDGDSTTTTGAADMVFSSFVNSIVAATIDAHDMKKEKSTEMPMISLYGNELRWSLRDAISYWGGYDEIYSAYFGVAGTKRGRNSLNENGSPQIHSFPGLLDNFTDPLDDVFT